MERSETMSVKKSWFLKSWSTEKSLSLTCAWMDLTVMKTEAKIRYLLSLCQPAHSIDTDVEQSTYSMMAHQK